MIRITIETANAAFDPATAGNTHAAAAGDEVARILDELADRMNRDGLPSPGEPYTLIDINGITVGEAIQDLI